MAEQNIALEETLKHLETLANASLSLWDLPNGAMVTLINVSENATYLVEAEGGYKAILRVNRENYHTRRAIECELAWLDALNADGVVTIPGYYLGNNNVAVQEYEVEGLPTKRFLVLFHFHPARS